MCREHGLIRLIYRAVIVNPIHVPLFSAAQKDCVGKVCLYVVLRAKKQGYDYAGRFGRCLFGSALGGGRSRRDLSVRIEQADLQMMRFDKLGFNALIEVYENFLFFDCKGGMSFCFFA